MRKKENEKQQLKRKAKGERELLRLLKEKNKSKRKGYIAHTLLICMTVLIVEEVCKYLLPNMKTVLATVFYAPSFGNDDAVAKMNTFALIASYFSGFAYLVKPLADRYGRKPFLIVNTFGMGLAMLVISLATNIPTYLIGATLVAFLTPLDMQSVYIVEAAPAKHRATFSAITKAVAALATIAIPLLRNTFVTGGDPASWQWHFVYLIPSIFAFAATLFILAFLRETDVFIDARIKQLQMKDEELEIAAKDKKSVANVRGGLIKGIKYVLTNKNLKWLLLASGFLSWTGVVTAEFEPILTMGYATSLLETGIELDVARATVTSEFINHTLILVPISGSFVMLARGFIADAIGRKKASIFMYLMGCIGFTLVVFGALHNWNPFAIGFIVGLAVGGLQAGQALIALMTFESSPTGLRASVSASFPVIAGLLMLCGKVVSVVIQNIFGDTSIIWVSMSIMFVSLILGLPIIMKKTKETVGNDLNSIGGSK